MADTSAVFTITARAIQGLVTEQTSYRPGDVATFTAHSVCIDNVVLEQSYDGINWITPATAQQTVTGDSIHATVVIECPSQASCGRLDTLDVYYRLRQRNRTTSSPAFRISVKLPRPAITVEPGDISRSRMRRLSWLPQSFGCDTLGVHISDDNGVSWQRLPVAITATGVYDPDIPQELAGPLLIRLCCETGPCDAATVSIEVERLPEGNFVAPNPFSPNSSGRALEQNARISYALQEDATVSVSIYDASRALVVRLIDGVVQNAGRQTLVWNGRNARGEIVTSGAYICVIGVSAGDQIILPIYITKH